MLRSYFRKADMILFAAALLIGIAGFFMLQKNTEAGTLVRIVSDGELQYELPLDSDGEYTVFSDHGYNIICIENGQVYMKDADCPNKDCMRYGRISNEGQMIICLPHRLVVSILSDEGGPDAISY